MGLGGKMLAIKKKTKNVFLFELQYRYLKYFTLDKLSTYGHITLSVGIFTGVGLLKYLPKDISPKIFNIRFRLF